MKKTNAERMAVMETKIEDIKESIEEHKIEQRKDFDLVFKKLDNLGNKFAGKWVEKVIIGVVTTVGAAVIVAVIYLIK